MKANEGLYVVLCRVFIGSKEMDGILECFLEIGNVVGGSLAEQLPVC